MKIKAELAFPRDLKEEPIICDLCKKFNITLNIIEASFSTEIGWAILIIAAEAGEMKKAFDYLKDYGVEIKNTQEQN